MLLHSHVCLRFIDVRAAHVVIKVSVMQCIALGHQSLPMIQAETDELASSLIKLQTEKN